MASTTTINPPQVARSPPPPLKPLPRLPIPTLSGSIERYLKSVKPLLLENAAKEGKGLEEVEAELRKRAAWGQDFIKPGGLGLLLQERLKGEPRPGAEATQNREPTYRFADVDRSCPNNWLDDAFWLKYAYHASRLPLPINSNWWLLMGDDAGIPLDVRQSFPAEGEYTKWQIRRAAKLVERLVDFKLKLDRQEILPDSSRVARATRFWFANRVFGLARIPQTTVDTLVYSKHPHPSTHIVVIANDHYYKLQVVSSPTHAIDLSTLEAQIWAIADDAKSRAAGEGVGICSADDRTTWAKARNYLLSLNPANREIMNTIEDSLFILSLDAHTIKSENYVSSSPISSTPDLEAHISNASSSAGTGRNRWWDKAISIHVESNGRGTMTGEHSPCDALIPSIVCDYVLEEGVAREFGGSKRGRAVTPLQRLEWVVDDQVRESIRKASGIIAALAADSDGKMLWYDEYGVKWIKENAKLSPDAYIQMAMQLAFHKTHNFSVATYETASTRLFLHGRTDVIRTLSEESWNWVQAMRSGKEDPKTLHDLLFKATKNHSISTRDSSSGRGCDRHFMGLRLLMQEGESHPLFDDDLFAQSQTWTLSTSGLSAGDRFHGTGFGAPYPDGYGINYLTGSEILKFGIESKRSNPTTSTAVFRSNLVEALREMREVCEKGQSVGSLKL